MTNTPPNTNQLSRSYILYRYTLGCLSTALLAAVVFGGAYWLFFGAIDTLALLPGSNPPRLPLSGALGLILLFTFLARLPSGGVTWREIKAAEWSMLLVALGCLVVAVLASGLAR